MLCSLSLDDFYMQKQSVIYIVMLIRSMLAIRYNKTLQFNINKRNKCAFEPFVLRMFIIQWKRFVWTFWFRRKLPERPINSNAYLWRLCCWVFRWPLKFSFHVIGWFWAQTLGPQKLAAASRGCWRHSWHHGSRNCWCIRTHKRNTPSRCKGLKIIFPKVLSYLKLIFWNYGV